MLNTAIKYAEDMVSALALTASRPGPTEEQIGVLSDDDKQMLIARSAVAAELAAQTINELRLVVKTAAQKLAEREKHDARNLPLPFSKSKPKSKEVANA